MKELMMKARSGVTLVELLVVILIVTILSVSMLPLLQPFVTEAQYAAEAIPVIANMRTKIGVFQYDKGCVPYSTQLTDVHTWKAGATTSVTTSSGGTGSGSTTTDVADSEKFGPTFYNLDSTGTTTAGTDVSKHLGTLIDVDYQDLKGKRSKPPHYQYCAISATNNISYVVGCFGDGNGFKAGTGYAVCELNFTKAQKKYIGTWKRYKPVNDAAGAIKFKTDTVTAGEKVDYCYIPDPDNFTPDNYANTAEKPQVITDMEDAGWEF